jgi:hypothetical protein
MDRAISLSYHRPANGGVRQGEAVVGRGEAVVGRKSQRAQCSACFNYVSASDLSRVLRMVFPRIQTSDFVVIIVARRPRGAAQIRRETTIADGGIPGRAEIFALPGDRSPMKRDGIPGLRVGGLKFKALNSLFCKMIQLIVA